jgi:hypothetical protein
MTATMALLSLRQERFIVPSNNSTMHMLMYSIVYCTVVTTLQAAAAIQLLLLSLRLLLSTPA